MTEPISAQLVCTVAQVRTMNQTAGLIEAFTSLLDRVVCDDEPLPLTLAVDAGLSIDCVCAMVLHIDARRLQLWASDCAEIAIQDARFVLPVFETAQPNEKRPRRAIEAAERCIMVVRSTIDHLTASYAASDTGLAAHAVIDVVDTAGSISVANAADAAACAAYAAHAAVSPAYAVYAANASANAARASGRVAKEERQAWCRSRLREYIAGTVNPLEPS